MTNITDEKFRTFFNDNVRAAMDLAGLNNAELARRAGMYDVEISRLLRGAVPWQCQKAVNVCNVLGLDMTIVLQRPARKKEIREMVLLAANKDSA